MGSRMMCATTENAGGAVVAHVAQKAGLRHCATTTPPKGGGVVVARGGAAEPAVARGAAE